MNFNKKHKNAEEHSYTYNYIFDYLIIPQCFDITNNQTYYEHRNYYQTKKLFSPLMSEL